jgi:hypothetical protein
MERLGHSPILLREALEDAGWNEPESAASSASRSRSASVPCEEANDSPIAGTTPGERSMFLDRHVLGRNRAYLRDAGLADVRGGASVSRKERDLAVVPLIVLGDELLEGVRR